MQTAESHKATAHAPRRPGVVRALLCANLLLLFLLGLPSALDAAIIRDEFNSGDYDGNDGLQPWSGSWEEIGESNGPYQPYVHVVESEYCAEGHCLLLGVEGEPFTFTVRAASRGADLSEAFSATLSFDYQRQGDFGVISVYVSDNGGSSWTEVQDLSWTEPDLELLHSDIDIRAYTTDETRVLFGGNAYSTSGGGFYVDNVQIEYSGIQPLNDIAVAKSVDNPAPGEGETIAYTVVVSVIGTGVAQNVGVADSLPAGLAFIAAETSQGSYDEGSGDWDVGDVSAGSSATLTIQAAVEMSTGGSTITNTASLSSFDFEDSFAGNNSDSADITVRTDLFVLQAGQDTWLKEWSPDESHGGDVELSCKSEADDGMRAVLRFDLSAIPPGAALDSATLGLQVTSPDDSGEPVRIHRITAAWDEADANWSNLAGDFDALTISGSFTPTTLGAVTADVTALAQQWLGGAQDNQGLMLIAGSEGIESKYASREWSTFGERPVLTLDLAGFADLAVTKTVDEPAPAEGETVTFGIALHNIGPEDAGSVALADTLPAGLSFVSANPSQGSYDELLGVWDVGALAAGVTAILSLAASVDPGTAGAQITNTAAVSQSDQGDGNPGNDTDSADVTVQSADRALSKTVDNPTPSVGDTVVFTIVLDNLGPDASTGVVVTDLLPAGLSFAGAAASQGDYDDGMGLWAVGTVAAAGAATLAISAVVDPGTEGTVIANTAAVTAGSPVDPAPDNDDDTAQVAVDGADLALDKIVDDPAPDEGDTVTFTLTLSNLGPAETTGIAVADTLPAGLSFVDAVASQGGYDEASGLWSVGGLLAGADATLALETLVEEGTAGSTIENLASIAAVDQADPEAENNSDGATLTVRAADLAVAKVVDEPTPFAGDPVTFTVTVSNEGLDDATEILVSDALPAGLTFDAALVSQGSYDEVTGIWDVGDLAFPAFAELRLTALVDDLPAGTEITNTAAVIHSAPVDPNPSNDSATALITLKGDPVADLSLIKTVDISAPAVGDPVTFHLFVDNAGPETALDVTVLDSLPAGLAFVFASPSSGSYDPGTGVWDLGDLSSGGGADMRLAAEVEPGDVGTEITNTATAAAASPPDPNLGDNSDSATITLHDSWPSVIDASASGQDGEALLPGAPAGLVLSLELLNTSAEQETLQSLRVLNGATGPGSQAQLDDDWTALDLTQITETEIEIGQRVPVSFVNGVATFSGLQVLLPPDRSVTLKILGGASLAARDGDVLDIFVNRAYDLVFSRPCSLAATWPLDPPEDFPVDGMAATQIAITDAGAGNLMTGSTRNLALDALLPANGYEADTLGKLNVSNWGSALAGEDIAAVELWADTGDGLFAPAVDDWLGALAFTGDRWELTALSEPVSLAGLRVFVSVDIAETATAGREVWLGFPTDPADVALGMTSDNDGPLDRFARNPAAQTISTQDRVTFSAYPLPDATVNPGQAGEALLQLLASNSYEITKTMIGLTLSNASSGVGGQSELDGEFEILRLRGDGDGDGELDDEVTDPVLSEAVFAGGRAAFDGFTWDLPPGEDAPRHLFVTGDLSLMRAADGDRLSVELAGAQDLEFADATTVSATWPVSSDCELTVDGMLAQQIVNHGAPGATLGPDEGPALALDIVVPANGYASDLFQHVQVLNLGSATESDLAELHLWRDGGDGILGEVEPFGSDDIDLGELAWLEGAWQSAFFTSSLGEEGARIFVSFTVSSSPSDSVTVQLALLLEGVTVASGNDGPIDIVVENPASQLISSAPLLANLWIDPEASILAQEVDVLMELRNLGDETVNDIEPSQLIAGGDGVLLELSGPQPASFDLAPAQVDTFRWLYRAEAPGLVQLSGSAAGTGETSGLTRLALDTQSNTHAIFVEAEDLALLATETMPPSFGQGQTDVSPFQFRFTNTDGASRVLVRALRIRVDDGAGQGIVPDELLSRVVLRVGEVVHLAKTELETSGDEVDLTLDLPLLVDGAEPVTLELLLDILPETLVPRFRVTVPGADYLAAEDATSGVPVSIFLEEGEFPLESGVAELELPATQLDVASGARALQRAAPGREGLPLQELQLENPGIEGLTADIRVPGFTVSLRDTSGALRLPPTAYLSRIRVRGPQHDYVDRSVGAGDDSTLVLSFSPLVEVPAGGALALEIECDLLAGSELGRFRLQLEADSLFFAQDASSGEPVPAVYQEPPLLGHEMWVEAQAETLLAAKLSGLPATVVVGDEDVSALALRIGHPGGLEQGRIRCDGLTVRCWDEARDSLPPANYIDRLRVFQGEQEIAVQADPPATGGSLYLPLPGLLLEAGDSLDLDLLLDVESTAPSSFLELAVDAAGWISVDANSGASVLLSPAPGEALPLASGLTWLESPARNLAVGLESLMPAVLTAWDYELPAALLSLRNAAPQGAGTIRVDHLVVRAAGRELDSLAVGTAASRVRAYLPGGQLWAESAELDPETGVALLEAGSELALTTGPALTLELRAVLREDADCASLRLGVNADDVGVVQPGNGLLQVQVQPEDGQVFPLWTQEGNFSPADLAASYANFPTPFAAGRESTAFVYYLDSPARVTLRIWTARGESVRALLDGSPREAGLHQDTTWDGRNGRGHVVMSGVYLAELQVDYDSGGRERLLRKVAVLR